MDTTTRFDPTHWHDGLPEQEPQPAQQVSPTLGLALSGGGFRATLFHLGVAWRLNEADLLRRVSRINAVSGGSILAARLGLAWDELLQAPSAVERATAFARLVAAPTRAFCGRTIDLFGLADNLATWVTHGRAHVMSSIFNSWLDDRSLADLPAGVDIIFFATSLQTLGRVSLSRRELRDNALGHINHPDLPLGVAVAASSAFPPALPPVEVALDPAQYVWQPPTEPSGWAPGTFADPAYRTLLYLTDGGVYDNLGVVTDWLAEQSWLVSDASGVYDAEATPSPNPVGAGTRAVGIMSDRINKRKKFEIVELIKASAFSSVYFGFKTDPAKTFKSLGKHLLPVDAAMLYTLGHVRTRLEHFNPAEQRGLINAGYACADGALRAYGFIDQGAMGMLPV